MLKNWISEPSLGQWDTTQRRDQEFSSSTVCQEFFEGFKVTLETQPVVKYRKVNIAGWVDSCLKMVDHFEQCRYWLYSDGTVGKSCSIRV